MIISIIHINVFDMKLFNGFKKFDKVMDELPGTPRRKSLAMPRRGVWKHENTSTSC